MERRGNSPNELADGAAAHESESVSISRIQLVLAEKRTTVHRSVKRIRKQDAMIKRVKQQDPGKAGTLLSNFLFPEAPQQPAAGVVGKVNYSTTSPLSAFAFGNSAY
jgi:hypothetical protein